MTLVHDFPNLKMLYLDLLNISVEYPTIYISVEYNYHIYFSWSNYKAWLYSLNNFFLQLLLIMFCNGSLLSLFFFYLIQHLVQCLHLQVLIKCMLNGWKSLDWWVPQSYLLPCSLQVASGPAPYCHSPWPQQQEASPSLVIDKSGNYFITWRFP